MDFVSRALGITHLDAYTRVDVRGQYRIGPRFEVFAVSENPLAAEYQEVLGYPALDRSIRAGLRLDLSIK